MKWLTFSNCGLCHRFRLLSERSGHTFSGGSFGSDSRRQLNLVFGLVCDGSYPCLNALRNFFVFHVSPVALTSVFIVITSLKVGFDSFS